MKKVLSLILCVLFIFCISACGKDESEIIYGGNGKTEMKSDEEIMLDLTKMNSTMVYAEVSQMLSKPEDYVGKTVKMNGTFNLFYNQNDESKTYYACVIKDATACCQQGLEFILKDGYEYPKLDDEITVKGTFEIYEEDGGKYCRIANADLLS